MGSRLGRRVIHFANLPIKLLLPNPPFDSIREFALKTVPSASKIEIRRVLESLYGFEIEDVRTLNMEGKKRHRGPYLAAKPDYKKAYITLKNPLSISPDLFPVPWLKEAMEARAAGKKGRGKAAVVGNGEGEGGSLQEVQQRQEQQKHWLDEVVRERGGGERRGDKRRGRGDSGRKKEVSGRGRKKEEVESKFPWSSMRSWR